MTFVAPGGAFFLVAVSTVAVLATSAEPADPSRDAALRPEISRLSRLRIFFGHQSVGMNLLNGVREIAARYPDVPLRVAEISGDLPAATFGHSFLQENGNPELKLQSFERALSAGAGAVADIAFLKFCYVDFSANTDARALFARYQSTLGALRARYPRLTFVHVTAPLTTVQGGARSALKRLLGRAPAGLLENARREQFNELMRGAYLGKEPLFDLAVLESTAPDGARERHQWNGSAIPALLPAYTDDGGHLNQQAQVRAARELIALLARLPLSP